MKKGDKVFYDSKEWTVTSDPDSGGYVWISDTAYNGSFNIIRKVDELKPVSEVPTYIMNKSCRWHNWKDYVGATEVYRYCDYCDLKEMTDWKEIGDGKKSN